MKEIPENMHEAEDIYGDALNSRYQDLWPFLEEVISISREVFTSFEIKPMTEISSSELTVRSLIARLIMDIHALATLSWRGYTAQFASLASSTVEVCFLVSYIGANDSTADKWLENTELFRSNPGLFDIIKNVIIHNDFEEILTEQEVNAKTQEEYRIYDYLCGVKHINTNYQNPITLRISEVEEEVGIYAMPQTTELHFHMTLWVWVNLFRLILNALENAARAHLPLPILHRVSGRIRALASRLTVLHDQLGETVNPTPS